MDAPRPRTCFQVRDDGAPVAGTRWGERRRVEDDEARRYVGQPTAPVDYEGLKPARELLRDGTALGGFDRAEVLIEQEHFGVVRREVQRCRQGRRAQDQGEVAGLEPRRAAHERAVGLEAPVRRLALGGAQRAVLRAPAGERRQPEPPRDDPVDVLEQQHLGEQVLAGRALLQLAHGFVSDLEQLRARQPVLVLLDALQQELLVLLLERAGRPARDARAVFVVQGAQHGSTCTVTSWSWRSFLRRSSTWSAIAWAAATSAPRRVSYHGIARLAPSVSAGTASRESVTPPGWAPCRSSFTAPRTSSKHVIERHPTMPRAPSVSNLPCP